MTRVLLLSLALTTLTVAAGLFLGLLMAGTFAYGLKGALMLLTTVLVGLAAYFAVEALFIESVSE